MKIISEKFGCTIIEDNNQYFIQYDNGQSASFIVQNRILKAEVAKAKISSKDAYEVIIEAEKRSKPVRVH